MALLLATSTAALPARAANLVIDQDGDYRAMLIAKHAATAISVLNVEEPDAINGVLSSADDLQTVAVLGDYAEDTEVKFTLDVDLDRDGTVDYVLSSDDDENDFDGSGTPINQMRIHSIGQAQWLIAWEDLRRDEEDLDTFGDFDDFMVAIYRAGSAPFPMCADGPDLCGLVIPLVYSGSLDDKLNVVFVPDIDDYRENMQSGESIDFALFLDHVVNVTKTNLLTPTPLNNNTDKFNFFFLPFAGNALSGEGGCQEHIPPFDDGLQYMIWADFYEERPANNIPTIPIPAIPAHTFVDGVAIVHIESFRDCSLGGAYSTEYDNQGSVNHESGHGLFGLKDEYCRYHENRTGPNIFCDLDTCEDNTHASPMDCRVVDFNGSADCTVDPECTDGVKSPHFHADLGTDDDDDIMSDNSGGYGPDCRFKINAVLDALPFPVYRGNEQVPAIVDVTFDLDQRLSREFPELAQVFAMLSLPPAQLALGDCPPSAVVFELFKDGDDLTVTEFHVVRGVPRKHVSTEDALVAVALTEDMEEIRTFGLEDPTEPEAIDVPERDTVADGHAVLVMPILDGLQFVQIRDGSSSGPPLTELIDLSDELFDHCSDIDYCSDGCRTLDTDNDCFKDFLELEEGTDPQDPDDFPDIKVPLPGLVVPGDLVIECTEPGGVSLSDQRIQDWLAEAAAIDMGFGATLTHDAPEFFASSCEGDPQPTVVTFEATDECGNSVFDTSTVTVLDTTAPDVSCSVAVDTLWPPNHMFVDVGLSFEVLDVCDENAEVVITVTSDERTSDAPGSGGPVHCPDAMITDDGHVLLRRERSGNGDGRVYEITVTVTDNCGNEGACSTQVAVNKSVGQPAIDSGQLYNATMCPSEPAALKGGMVPRTAGRQTR